MRSEWETAKEKNHLRKEIFAPMQLNAIKKVAGEDICVTYKYN